MPQLISAPPKTPPEPVTDIIHGVPVTDPYRWLEDQIAPRTRAWIDEQKRYSRSYLNSLPGRERVRHRVREFLAVETYDSLLEGGGRYFFRKRLAEQEQPCIYMRQGPEGEDELLVEPLELGRGVHAAVKPLRASRDGRLLLYEIKEGGERSGTFAIYDVDAQTTLPDSLPRGYLRGFAFASNSKSFCYVHESLDHKDSSRTAAYVHILGTDFHQDRQIFAREESRSRIAIVSNGERLGFLVYRFGPTTQTDFYVQSFDSGDSPETIVRGTAFAFSPVLIGGKIIAKTNHQAPNSRIVELRRREDGHYEWLGLIPESEARIQRWLVAGGQIFIS